MISRILVPLDGSVVAEAILPHLEAFARLVGAEVTLLQAVEPWEEMVGAPAAGASDPDAGLAAQGLPIKAIGNR
jgi:nucleotide-binding universal stress UspA family protein